MISEKNKATRITKELIGYFLEHKYCQFDLSFDLNDDRFELTIAAPSQDVPTHFDHLLDDLNTEREVEIDEYYNALLGGHDTDHDYTLLGKSVDTASIAYENGRLILKVCRKLD